MVSYLELPIGPRVPHSVNMIVEIPAGSVNKYEFDKDLGVFRLDRNLHSPVHYPGDYGFIPRTLALDGDPLDVLVLVDEPTFTSCLVEVRPIGMLEMSDQGHSDEKILAVGVNNPRYGEVYNYTQIYDHLLKEISHFFATYKDLEGKRMEVRGWHDVGKAQQAILESAERYEMKHSGHVGASN